MIYWIGNAVKAMVINDILKEVELRKDEVFTIFDYGCGNGGNWDKI